MHFELVLEMDYLEEKKIILTEREGDLSLTLSQKDKEDVCIEMEDYKFAKLLENIMAVHSTKNIEDASHWRIINDPCDGYISIQKLVNGKFLTKHSAFSEEEAIRKLQFIKAGTKIIHEEIF